MSGAVLKARRSPLELLHPDGIANTALVLGDACPEELRPSSEATDVIDLVVVAGAEVEAAARTAAERLAPDGIVFFGDGSRGAERAAKRAGIVKVETFFTLHGGGSRHLLVPARARAARFALDQLVPAAGWKGRSARLATRAGGSRLLPHVTRSAVVARRPGARPLHEWLGTEAGLDAGCAIVSWSDSPSLVVHTLSAHGEPRVVKLGDVTPEAGALRQLGPGARAAGGRVPLAIRNGSVAGLPLLVETAVPGKSAVALLGTEPRRLRGYLDELVAWLERWNVETATRKPVSLAQLERALLAPLHALDLSADYERRLEELCARAEGGVVPLVAAHHDLTTANVLVDGALGIVDWATAEPAALPLTDFFYAVADARAAAGRFEDRVAAFTKTFAPDGTPAPDVAPLQRRLVEALDLDHEMVELCFHACWLRHAANELADSGAGPFVEIVRTIAATA